MGGPLMAFGQEPLALVEDLARLLGLPRQAGANLLEQLDGVAAWNDRRSGQRNAPGLADHLLQQVKGLEVGHDLSLLNLSLRSSITNGGTRPSAGPPRATTSRMRLEDR